MSSDEVARARDAVALNAQRGFDRNRSLAEALDALIEERGQGRR